MYGGTGPYDPEKAWDQGRRADHAEASGGQSSWEVDLGEACARVEQLGCGASGSRNRPRKSVDELRDVDAR